MECGIDSKGPSSTSESYSMMTVYLDRFGNLRRVSFFSTARGHRRMSTPPKLTWPKLPLSLEPYQIDYWIDPRIDIDTSMRTV